MPPPFEHTLQSRQRIGHPVEKASRRVQLSAVVQVSAWHGAPSRFCHCGLVDLAIGHVWGMHAVEVPMMILTHLERLWVTMLENDDGWIARLHGGIHIGVRCPPTAN